MQILFQKPTLKKLKRQGLTYVDMHYHTSASDSSANLFLTLQRAKLMKAGIAITDHNDIKAAVKASQHKNILIIPGIEVTSYDYMDLLIYFYNMEDLKHFFITHIYGQTRPNRGFDYNRSKYNMKELLNVLDNYKCVKALAHPFISNPQTSYYYFDSHKQLLKKIDAIEGLNSLLTPEQNRKAIEWAKKIKKPVIGGSDAHTIYHLGKVFTISEDSTIESFLDSIKKNKHVVMGEHVTGLSRWYAGLIIFKNNLRLRLKEEVDTFKEKSKARIKKLKGL